MSLTVMTRWDVRGVMVRWDLRGVMSRWDVSGVMARWDVRGVMAVRSTLNNKMDVCDVVAVGN